MRYLDCEHGLRSSINYEQLCRILKSVACFTPGEGEQLHPPLHVVGDSALILSQLRSHHSPRKAHLALLFRKARDLADDIAVFIWGHHYRTFNKMADRPCQFAMDSCTSVQVHLPSDRLVVKEVATFLDSDVTRWLENSHNELSNPRSPTATAKDKAISRLQLAQRTAAVQGQTLT
uniref:RNase H type-1 domain-containing protein n=1 Tax=Hyaloperonospora arabidopsidis (strain Emoy2) TaxID=559515 RepID=M4BSW0_HYAAE